MNLLDRIFDGIQSFPPLPQIYTTLSAGNDDPDKIAEDTARIIDSDHVSKAKILRATNSICCDGNNQVETISQAIERLGLIEVKNLIAAVSIIEKFSKIDNAYERDNTIDVWSHSIGVGLMSRYIGKSMGAQCVHDFFLAGFLHDVGKILFLQYAADEYSDALKRAKENNLFIKDAEMEVLGIDHSFAGELLAESWNLPRTYKHAIRYHHSGMVEDKYNIIVASVHIANVMIRLLRLGFPGDSGIPRPNKQVWSILKLPPAAFSSIIPKFLEKYRDTVALFFDYNKQ